MGTHECYIGPEQNSAAVRLATRSLGDLKSPPAIRRPRPANLDLTAAKTSSSSSSSSGLQTPNSATHDSFSGSSSSSLSLHTKYRAPSLPTNNVVGDELSDCVEGMSVDELCALLSDLHEKPAYSRMPPSPNSSKSATPTNSLLLIDIRPFSQYSEERVAGAINICIPSTLLKRSSFDLARFLDCMAPEQRAHLADLAVYDHIVVYDANSTQLVAGSPLHHTLVKFVRAASAAKLAFVHGGFLAFARRHPDLIDRADLGSTTKPQNHVTAMRLKLDPMPTSTGVLANGGGLSLPKESVREGPLRAFASNIRAEMEVFRDTVDVRVPEMGATADDVLPDWLLEIYAQASDCKVVAHKFQQLEVTERDRLKSAFDPTGNATRLAGVEMGIKNRYHNIWPFDHSRVRIKHNPASDYINANYITTDLSRRRYIATQGPLPTTYTDFWHVVWEQRVPVIVMLTPEVENGLLKCNAYWRESINPDDRLSLTVESETPTTLTPATGTEVMVRRFTLTDKQDQTSHSVVQIQYTNWPDFGSPANAEDLLALSTTKQQYIDEYKTLHNPNFEPYALVHCSAGCGRTGTFCAIDTCVDVFSSSHAKPAHDVVFQAVDEMRRQRLSMVQNLRQFALCYECILLWCAKYQNP